MAFAGQIFVKTCLKLLLTTAQKRAEGINAKQLYEVSWSCCSEHSEVSQLQKNSYTAPSNWDHGV